MLGGPKHTVFSGVKFEEGGDNICDFVLSWEATVFRIVWGAPWHRYSSESSQ